MNNNQGKAKKPDLTMSVPIGDCEDAFATDDSEEEEIDDQTDAFLKGFESDDDSLKDPEDQGYKVGDEIPKVGKKIRKKAKAATAAPRRRR